MTDQRSKARAFAALHRKGDPIILYNVWDAGSAKAVAQAGAKALATGSYSVAMAHGFADRENTPLTLALDNLKRIVAAADLPVTLDFEGGYAADAAGVGHNVGLAIEAGAVGMNFEDQIIGGKGLHDVAVQSGRISAARKAADDAGIPFFINARTDIFLQADRASHSTDHIAQALERAHAYADAGANGFFVPALVGPDFIAEIVEWSPLPINILMIPGVPSTAELKKLGVSRISYGGAPYRVAMAALESAAKEAFAG